MEQNVTWKPRAGNVGVLQGSATIGGSAWVKQPRLQTSTLHSIAGNSKASFVAGLSPNCCNCSSSVVFIGNSANCNARMFGQFASSDGTSYIISVKTLGSGCDAPISWSAGVSSCMLAMKR
jgi:hypothetical protein